MQREQLFFDTTDATWTKWRPLANATARSEARGLGAEGILKIGAFGTCGDPSSPEYESWRHKYLLPVLRQYGINEERVFNPEVAEWSPTRAPIESVHLARDLVLGIAATNQTDSPASIMEAGFGAYGGILRGQDVVVFLENNAQSPERTRTARKLAQQVLRATEAQYPLFKLAHSLDTLSHQVGVSLQEKLRRQNSGVVFKTECTLPPQRDDLDPTIYLSGTSGPRKPKWMTKVQQAAKKYNTLVDDSYRPDWNSMDADAELMHKLGNAVHLIAITEETESLGALAELGPRLMYADLAGQSIGVYIEQHKSAPNSNTNRTRTLAKAHLARLREDFPSLPVFVADNLEQLVVFGLSEHFKQKQRLAI